MCRPLHLLPVLLFIHCLLPLVVSAHEQSAPLRIITEHSPPASYLNEQGKVAGATTELITQLANQLDEDIRIELMPWARAFYTATSQPRTALFETALSEERKPLFHWVGPLKVYRLWVYGRQDRLTGPINLAELSRSYIACESLDSIYLQYWQQLGFTTERRLALTPRKAQCRDMFLQQRVDLIIWNELFAGSLQQDLRQQGTELVPLMPIDDIYLYLVFSLDHSVAYIQQWQDALEQSYRDGSMRALYQGVFPEAVIQRLEAFAQQPLPN